VLPDGSRRATRHPARIIIVVLIGLIAAIAAWALLPRSLGTITVERVELLAGGVADGSSKPPELTTPIRLAVTFSASDDLDRIRRRAGLGYIAVRLADCRDADLATTEVAAQRASYLADYGRVRRLPAALGGKARYLAVFDEQLRQTVNHETRRIPAQAAPGGLCVALYGASMWFGHGRSNSVLVGPSWRK
jgi:hypothetical protein